MISNSLVGGSMRLMQSSAGPHNESLRRPCHAWSAPQIEFFFSKKASKSRSTLILDFVSSCRPMVKYANALFGHTRLDPLSMAADPWTVLCCKFFCHSSGLISLYMYTRFWQGMNHKTIQDVGPVSCVGAGAERQSCYCTVLRRIASAVHGSVKCAQQGRRRESRISRDFILANASLPWLSRTLQLIRQ